MDGVKKTILIIEDDSPTRSILIEKIQSSGYSTLQAKDGDEGLEIATQNHPDVILLDLLMPKMGGMTMLTKLRSDAWGKNVPVIILTNVSADADTTLKAIVDTQPAYYLLKSDMKLEDIIEKIKEILSPPVKPS